MPIAAVIKGTTYAVHSDHLNTPRKLTQANGQTAWQWAYSAFGDEQPTIAAKRFTSETTNPTTGTTSTPEVTFNLRYPGQYFDKETKLHYNYFRSYDSRTGRYTQGDPIGLDGGWNRFGYVSGNPLGKTDRLGLSPEDVRRIKEIYVRVVDEMTRNGDRLNLYIFNNTFAESRDDENPLWPNAIPGTLNNIFRNGKSTLICGQQWDKVYNELMKIKSLLDDDWEFPAQNDPGHTFGRGVSSNPSDPSLILDPWKNKFIINYKMR